MPTTMQTQASTCPAVVRRTHVLWDAACLQPCYPCCAATGCLNPPSPSSSTSLYSPPFQNFGQHPRSDGQGDMENRTGELAPESTISSPISPPLFLFPPPPPLSFIPPPPPLLFVPPPPPPAFSNRTSKADSAVHVDDRKKALERDQEDLQDSRDDYTGLRFHLQSKRTSLRRLREETGSKIGSAENQLRQFLHTLSIELPPAIQKTFDEASTLRDRLGSLEAEYDESEGQYNRVEYTYTQKETRFVDQISSDFLVRSTPSRNTAANLEAEGLTRFADGALDEVHMPETIAEADLITPVSKPFGSCLSDSVPTTEHLNSCRYNHSTGEPPCNGGKPDPTTLEAEWMNKKNRIDTWLLHMLSCSPMQKVHLKAMGPPVNLSDQAWWERLKEHWNDDFLMGPAFRTGDSTASHSLTSRHAATSTLNLDDPESMKANNSQSLLPFRSTGESFDATNSSDALVSVHSEIGSPSDFECHVAPLQKNVDVGEAKSVLTGPASTRQTFSSPDCRSPATIPSSCPNHEPLEGCRMQSLVSVSKSGMNDTPEQQNPKDDPDHITPKEGRIDNSTLGSISLSTNTCDPSSEEGTQLPDIPEYPKIEDSTTLGEKNGDTTTVPVSGMGEYVLIPEPDRIPFLPSPQPSALNPLYSWPLSSLSLQRCPIPPTLRGGEFIRWGRKSCPILKFIPREARQSYLQEPPVPASPTCSIRPPSPSLDDLCE